MIEFMTPYDILEKFVYMIENKRVKKNMTQEELCKAACMTKRSYANFIKTKNTKFVNIINLLIALDLTSKVEELIKNESYSSLDEIRKKNSKTTKKRVRKQGIKHERD